MHDLSKYETDEDRELQALAEEYEAAIFLRDHGHAEAVRLTAAMEASTSTVARVDLAVDLTVAGVLRDHGAAWMQRLEAAASAIEVTLLESMHWLEERATDVVELDALFDGPAFGESS